MKNIVNRMILKTRWNWKLGMKLETVDEIGNWMELDENESFGKNS